MLETPPPLPGEMGRCRPDTLVAVGLAAAVLVAAAGWPALGSPSAVVLGGANGDFASIAWGLDRVAQAFPGVPLPHDPTIAFPRGATLLVADLPEAWLLAPVTRIWGPVFSFNLLQILHPALAAAAAYLLLASLGARSAGALGGALAFALSPVLLSGLHNGNPDVTPLYWIPLAAWAATRLDRSWWWATGTVVAIGLGAWCNPYVGVMAGITALLLAPWGRLRMRWRHGVATFASAGAVGGAYVAWVMATLSSADAMMFKSGARPLSAGVAHLRGFVLPEVQAQPGAEMVHAWYLGLVPLGLAGAGWIGRCGQRRRFALLGLVGVLLAMGPALHLGPETVQLGDRVIPMPGWLLQELPGLGSLQIAYRYATLCALAVAALAARGIDRLPTPSLRWGAVALVAIDLMVLGRGHEMAASSAVPVEPTCLLLADLDEGPILDLPGTFDERWMLAQTCHHRPIAQGLNRPVEPTALAAARQPGLTAFAALRDQGFRYLVLHEDLADVTAESEIIPPGQHRLVDQLRSSGSQRIVAQQAGVTIVDLAAP